MPEGNSLTREFYDQVGWKRGQDEDRLKDSELFGATEEGPIRIEIYARQVQRIRDMLRSAGDPLNLLECGCGANPAVWNLRDGDRYVGVDFSSTGLAEADRILQAWGGPYRLQQADVCNLPFADGEFDAIYSAHVLYHIDDTEAQAAALKEMARVLRPGGVAVLQLANPRPILFPIRLGMRLVADTPVLNSLANRFRKKGPLPYRPLKISWYKRQLQPYGTLEVLTGGLPSNQFARNVTEHRYPSKFLWQAIRSLDIRAPHLSAWLGNYFLLYFRKT